VTLIVYIRALLQISNIKKPINIPIGDFTIDSDYEKNVLPNFKLPPSFVRHTKKIGDERDIAADYVMEDDDQVNVSILEVMDNIIFSHYN
jgi:hypothetical protein